MHPLLPAGGPHEQELRLVRRHQKELVELFARGVGYRLAVEPSGARLFKAGLGRDATRGLRRRSGADFTPRTYALLTLVVAALTRCPAQLLVDELVAQVRSAAVDAGIDIDLDASADRRALHAALLALVQFGVLAERDGDLEHWVDQRTESLLDVRRDLLSQLVTGPLASATSADDLLEQAALPSAAGGARVAVRRLLLESPVLTVADLPDEQVEWWGRNRNRERDWFTDGFGLELELRAEGAIGIDPDDELSDEEFPGRGAGRHLALLLLETLANHARDTSPGETRPWRSIRRGAVQAQLLGVVTQWSEGLRADQRADAARAVDEALDLLVRVGLVRREQGNETTLFVHAAASRYAPRPMLTERATTGEPSLFDTDPTEDHE